MNYEKVDFQCGGPSFEPEKWELTEKEHDITNCYSYAFERKEEEGTREDKLQPGELSGQEFKVYECNEIINKMMLDHPALKKINSIHEEIPCDHYKIALVLDKKGENKDYHFYRQDSDGYWSHKTGDNNVTNVDASGNKISNPELCDRNYDKEGDDKYYYNIFCGYFSTPYNGGPFKVSEK
tara:strand:+ start:54 stop:596 length:543 start_codon:yes stop_codon:yes gene_type:complete